MDRSPPASRHRALIRLALHALGLVAICVAVMALVGQDPTRALTALEPLLLTALVVAFAMLTLLAAIGWRWCLAATSGASPGLGLALVNVSYMLVAKYLPGKVWGVLARVALAPSAGVTATAVVRASVAEQMLTIWAGMVVGGSALALPWLSPLAIVACALLALALTPLAVSTALSMLGVLVRLVPALRRRVDPTHLGLRLAATQALRVVMPYLVSWVIIVGCVALLTHAIASTPAREAIAVGGAYAVGTLAGFVVLLAPGGIGVRESAFVLLSLPFIEARDAIAVAAALRIWTTAGDVAAGLLGQVLAARLVDQTGGTPA
ncbi:MAG: flippase-like domain-containing protein [Ectothiorhodospiraceae bacterium]|nr:flippase-like domain-containing protein [Chromatiales bacterium]MCP5157147.1 flippase-like domain-containing protein [Ectothiorhodospiraceae bacterium]